MRELDHLQQYQLTLSVRSPLFVGTGRKLLKSEYLYYPKNGVVAFLDEGAFLQMLFQRQMVDEYERYILSGRRDLERFLRDECGLDSKEIMDLTPRYLKAGSAVEDVRRAEIYRFQTDAAGRSYVPGSALKGALRTVWLTARILEGQDQRRFAQPDPRQRNVNSVLEGAFANLLQCDRKNRNNAVNSIFRGLLISDSAPIPPRQFTLCRKYDVGVTGEGHWLNVVRECVKPTTQISFQLTLDQSILRGRITAQSLMEDIAQWSRFYREHYLSRFDPPRNAADVMNERCILLGGGTGFFAKSLKYPYWGDAQALEDVSAQLERSFRAHRHLQRDRELGISPRMMKYTEYERRMYPFGVCGVQIQ
ncbi:MAG: type III-A CRISPR-associated RAMP protein Csm5 [Oscillospiraceae bacterium]|nr:type III-A CRISPR-associated RAMP protein Csm5 [Oscillospiraceae bacterium]